MAEEKRAFQQLKDLSLSGEEISKFTKAFKDPEFNKLFQEYAKDLQNPETRAETDAYLSQIEQEGRIQEVYGKDAQLIVPCKGYVLKTRDKKSKKKVFINICTSSEVEIYKKEASPIGLGSDLSIPMLTVKESKTKDVKSAECIVWDIVVNPDTCKAADQSQRIQQAFQDSIIEQIEARNTSLQLDRQCKRLSKSYQPSELRDQPHAVILKQDGKGGLAAPNSKAPVWQQMSNNEGKEDIENRKPSAQNEQQCESEFSLKFKGPNPNKQKTAKDPGYVYEDNYVTPQYRIVHRGEIDLGSAWGDMGRKIHMNTTRPKELVVKVELPGVQSPRDIDVDCQELQLTLEVEGKYRLKCALPFLVDHTTVKAKWYKTKCTLDLAVNVVPPDMEELLPEGKKIKEVLADEQSEEQHQIQKNNISTINETQDQHIYTSMPDDPPKDQQIVQANDNLNYTKDVENGDTQQQKIQTQLENVKQLTDNQKLWQQVHQSNTQNGDDHSKNKSSQDTQDNPNNSETGTEQTQNTHVDERSSICTDQIEKKQDNIGQTEVLKPAREMTDTNEQSFYVQPRTCMAIVNELD